MNRSRSIVALAFAGALVSLSILSLAHGNDSNTAQVTIGKTTVKVEYHSPSLRGRDLMKMIHPGDLWRVGADAPTTIESNADLDFGGTRVPKGEHVLLARYIEPGKWTLVVSGKDRMHYEPSAKIAEIPLQTESGQASLEQLKIDLSKKGRKGIIEIAWGTYRLTGSFEPAS